MKQNPYFQQVQKRYLFKEIHDRVQAFKKDNPSAAVISLGIGDTTQPVNAVCIQALQDAVLDQGDEKRYVGYGPEQGIRELREEISAVVYNNQIRPDEIFISDGAKCDIGRLQILFGPNVRIAMQDPTYPVYLDTANLTRSAPITLLACTPENNFMPDLERAKDVDVLFLCAPNNPTGTTFSFDELTHIVEVAKKHQILIVYDSAYSFFVQDGPKSIYEIPGATEVAIELGSFSKIAGFSGIRLGWSVMPHALKYDNGESLHDNWSRIHSTFFNGASILSQKGAIAVLKPQGLAEINKQIAYYLENSKMLKTALKNLGAQVYGGENIPYVWMRMNAMSSWELFDHFLHQAHAVTTPGVGFGPSGEGFCRLSGFAKKADIQEAITRFKALI